VGTYTSKDDDGYVRADIVARLDRPTLECMSIGERIKQARAKKGLTQNALANLIAATNPKFAPINISRWETETQALSSANAILLAQALGVSVDWILNGTEAPAPQESRVEQDVFTADEMTRMTDFLGFEPTRKQILDAMHGLDFHRADWRKIAKIIEMRQSMEVA
jgi:transcriptional regulator with XRE-family HTH domain